jgi:hypothetical protein
MLPYDVEKVLQTAEDCRRVMARALAKGDVELYQAAFRRLCALTGAAHDNSTDPLVRAAWEAVAAYEQTLYQKHGRNQSAARTRQKIKAKGVYQALLEWGKLRGNRPGFKSLIDAGLPEFTFEAVILKFAQRFPPDVVEACRLTLAEAGAKL